MTTINRDLFLLEQKSFNAVFYDGDRFELAAEEAADYIISAMEKQFKGYSFYYCAINKYEKPSLRSLYYEDEPHYYIKKAPGEWNEKYDMVLIKKSEIEYLGERYSWGIYSMSKKDALLKKGVVELLWSACGMRSDTIFSAPFFFVVKDEINYECFDDYLKRLVLREYLPSFRKEVMEFFILHKIYPIGIHHGCDGIGVWLYGDKGDWRRNYYLNRRKKKK